MGSVISQAANGIGGVVGNAFAVPIKTIFGMSCEDVCSGQWDLICFIEHLCVSDLLKLLMVFGLSYITLMFFYLLFKVGIFQCIVKSLCKVCWAGCETYCFALEDITCFLWHKLKNTRRVNRRRRFRDIEAGYTSSSETDFSEDHHHFGRKRKPIMERRKIRSRPRMSRYPSSRVSILPLKEPAMFGFNPFLFIITNAEYAVHLYNEGMAQFSCRGLQSANI